MVLEGGETPTETMTAPVEDDSPNRRGVLLPPDPEAAVRACNAANLRALGKGEPNVESLLSGTDVLPLVDAAIACMAASLRALGNGETNAESGNVVVDVDADAGTDDGKPLCTDGRRELDAT